jgi:hypothetical protein
MSARLAAESNKFCTRSSDCKLELGGISKRDCLVLCVDPSLFRTRCVFETSTQWNEFNEFDQSVII